MQVLTLSKETKVKCVDRRAFKRFKRKKYLAIVDDLVVDIAVTAGKIANLCYDGNAARYKNYTLILDRSSLLTYTRNHCRSKMVPKYKKLIKRVYETQKIECWDDKVSSYQKLNIYMVFDCERDYAKYKLSN